jgi:hypothetical protein
VGTRRRNRADAQAIVHRRHVGLLQGDALRGGACRRRVGDAFEGHGAVVDLDVDVPGVVDDLFAPEQRHLDMEHGPLVALGRR